MGEQTEQDGGHPTQPQTSSAGRGEETASTLHSAQPRETLAPQNSSLLDDWIAIGQDGTVTVFSGKVELGTGVRTALAQIVAEELDVPLDRIRTVMGDTELTPNEGLTAGSQTIQVGGAALREASANARQVLLEMATERLDAAVDELVVREGVILARDYPSRQVSYAELMGGKRFNRQVTGTIKPKLPDSYHIVGTSVARLDLPAKITGQPSFIQDLRVPGMVHARVVRPPSPGATLVSIDKDSIRDIPGLVQIVHVGNFVGVIAEGEQEARRAASQLKVTWQEQATLPMMDGVYEHIRRQPTFDQIVVESGDVARALEGAATRLSATYYQPFQNHASIGPSCAVADFSGDHIQVWSNTQGIYMLRGAIADLLELQPDKVHVTHVEGAGSYGHNGSNDAAADAAILSRAVGRPVRVQWSREEDFAWEPKAPAMVMQIEGGLDARGKVVAWNYQVWTPSHAMTARAGSELLTSRLMTGKTPAPRPLFIGGDRNAPTNYQFPNNRVTAHWLASLPLFASAFRSLGAAANTFANESFMDELAAAVGRDPLTFRLNHLTDERARDVLHAAAETAGWQERPPHSRLENGVAHGQGIAFARYANAAAFVATVAQVEANPADGRVRVTRIVVAHDCGLIINPDGLRNQIEGNVVQSLSRALKEEVRFDETRILSVDWESYPILTFSEVPEIDVVLVNRPDEPAVGAGEPATITTAPAVANAIYDAIGVRVRQIPFTAARVRQAQA